jgi:hypothetical protein
MYPEMRDGARRFCRPRSPAERSLKEWFEDIARDTQRALSPLE